MTRTQWTLAGILVVQLLVLALVASPWSSGSGTIGPHALLPELASFTPAKIEIQEGDQTLDLERQNDGWVVDQADDFPADASKVDGLLTELRDLQVRRPVVSSSRYHDALKVSEKDNERRLKIWGSGTDASEPIDLFIGSSPNYGVSNVRRNDQDEVYEARGLSPWDLRADSGTWIDKRLVDVEPDKVTSLTLTNDHGSIELVKQDGTWSLAGGAPSQGQLDPTKVDAFVRTVGSLRFSEPAGKLDSQADAAFQKPAATLELGYAGAEGATQSVSVVVGAESEAKSGKRYAKRAGDEYRVILAKWDAERLVNEKLGDLLSGDTAKPTAGK